MTPPASTASRQLVVNLAAMVAGVVIAGGMGIWLLNLSLSPRLAFWILMAACWGAAVVGRAHGDRRVFGGALAGATALLVVSTDIR
jgi:hypothetical protein